MVAIVCTVLFLCGQNIYASTVYNDTEENDSHEKAQLIMKNEQTDSQFVSGSTLSYRYVTGALTQVVPNYAVPKINPNTLPKIYAENNSLKLNDKSYFVWITEGGGKYTWAVNGGNVGWVSSCFGR